MGRTRSKSYLEGKKEKKNKTLVDKISLVDRLSNLPDDVMKHILSYLQLKEAVKTCVVSKVWERKWAMLVSLSFDDACGTSIERIVNHVLFLHTGPVEAFKLSTERRLNAGDIDLWISRLFQLSGSSIKKFVLKPWNMDSRYNVFSRLFSFRYLTHLKLRNCVITPPSTFQGFPALKDLHIRRVTMAQGALEKLIAGGPLLERMTIRLVWGLKQLNVYAPNLRFLKVIGYFCDIRLENTTKLVDVVIDGKWYSSQFVKFFLQLPKAKATLERLTIKLREKNMMCLDHDPRISIAICDRFSQLEVLKVTGYFGEHEDDVEFIRFLLSNSPKLKKIVLERVSGTNPCWEMLMMLNDFGNVEKSFLDPITDDQLPSF